MWPIRERPDGESEDSFAESPACCLQEPTDQVKLIVVNVTGNGVMVVAIEGRVNSSTVPKFERVLDAVADAGKKGMVLDLENLTYISSAGLRVLLELTKARAQQGGMLTVCSVPDSLRRILQVSGFDQIIPVHDSQAEALAACSR